MWAVCPGHRRLTLKLAELGGANLLQVTCGLDTGGPGVRFGGVEVREFASLCWVSPSTFLAEFKKSGMSKFEPNQIIFRTRNRCRSRE